MKLSDLFELKYGNSFELINMTVNENENINFISRTSNNNGVVAKVKKNENYPPFPSGLLTVALGGSVLSTFVQSKSFYTGFHVMVLIPKKEMTLNEKMFYAMCINANAYKYGYGRQANKSLKDIIIPDDVPEWVENYEIGFDLLNTNIRKTNPNLDVNCWGKFNLVDYFDMYAGKYYNTDEYSCGNTPLVSTSDNENGIMAYTDLIPIFPKNCLTIGKVGITTFYQNKSLCASPDVTVLIPKERFNKYIGLFIKSVIDLEKHKWSYGRQIRLGDCKELSIKLPLTSKGTPDWEYMEQYIKSLPYSDKI